MNFWQWLKTHLTQPTPTYDPADDKIVQELKQQAALYRRQAAIIRRARTQGQDYSFEEMWGREPQQEGFD